MKKENSTQGFGLAVASIVILAVAFIIIFFLQNQILATIIALFSAIIAAAAYIEARRANGPRKFTLTCLIIAILGAFFAFLYTGTDKIPGPVKKAPEEIVVPPDPDVPDPDGKLDELQEKAEELERDSL